jgi:SEC-C motif-containing protein
MRCPCRKKSEAVAYDECCAPFHAGTAVPPTAEALMRSRYAAFALGDAAYLKATWHASTRPERLDLDPTQEWLALKIRGMETSRYDATVTFEARSKVGGSATCARRDVPVFA